MDKKELSGSSRFLSKLPDNHWVRPIITSAALVLPCFWQPIVSGADMQSHLYNAWLAELIRHGGMHGLWIGHQSTNILVDLLLPWLLRCFGASGAERIIATALVLVFFWGAFHFISAVRGQKAYWVAPWLAILSYGFVFQVGLLNYYLSCGIILWLFAITWRRRLGWRMLWAAPLPVLAYLAHPLPVLWFLGIAFYCLLAQRMKARFQLLLFLGGVACLLLIRCYIVAHYLTVWVNYQLVLWTGADQALWHGSLFPLVAAGFLLFSAALLVSPENRWRTLASVPAQAFFLTAVAIAAIPSSIQSSALTAAASSISPRLSLLSGVLLLALLAQSTYRRWLFPAGLLTAAIFFGALYHETGREALEEAQMEKLVGSLPAGARVVSYADITRMEAYGLRPMKRHLLSRACLGHCFDYMNYEPSASQFRIHAAPGNSIVLATLAEERSMIAGTYVVKASDSPLYALIRCETGSGQMPDTAEIVMRPLTTGESGAMLTCPKSPSIDK
jgi:hypothetical protein